MKYHVLKRSGSLPLMGTKVRTARNSHRRTRFKKSDKKNLLIKKKSATSKPSAMLLAGQVKNRKQVLTGV